MEQGNVKGESGNDVRNINAMEGKTGRAIGICNSRRGVAVGRERVTVLMGKMRADRHCRRQKKLAAASCGMH